MMSEQEYIVSLLAGLEAISKLDKQTSLSLDDQLISEKHDDIVKLLDGLSSFFGRPLYKIEARDIVLLPGLSLAQPYLERAYLNLKRGCDILSSEGRQLSDLRIGASTGSGNALLLQALARFRQDFPLAELNITIDSSDHIQGRVECGELRLGIVGFLDESSPLEYIPIMEDRMILVAAANGPWSDLENISLSQLQEFTLLVEQADSGSRKTLEKELERLGYPLKGFSKTIEFGLHEGVKKAVLTGTGVAILPYLSVAQELQKNRLRELRILEGDLNRSFYLVYSPREELSYLEKSVIKYLRELN